MKARYSKWNLPLVFMSLFLLPCLSCGPAAKIDNTPVPKLDLEKFLGQWYEIARFDHKFERGLSLVTAHYSMREDGKIRVLNTGFKNGEKKTAEGKAKVAEPELGNGYLRVAFFWIFYADYRILVLDEDYQYALIGSKKDNYLWIMSRSPYLEAQTRAHLIDEARARGYDTDRLIWVRQ